MRNREVMKKLVAVTLVSLVAGASVLAADLSDGSAVVADLSVMAVDAKAAVAEAATTGDLIAISKAQAKADAIDAALAIANEQYAEMERAIAAGDQAAADEAFAAIEAARDEAVNPATPQQQPVVAGKRAATGGSGSSVPNIYERLSATTAEAAIAQTEFAVATAGGGSTPPPPGNEQTPL
jgi:hypothetical protein